MIELDIPGWGTRKLEHLVLDFNGTLAEAGKLIEGVEDRLPLLSVRLRLHVCTADTFGTAAAETRRFEAALKLLKPGGQDEQKAELVRHLGPLRTAAIGNGRNDALMLREAALGVAVLGREGLCPDVLQTADVLCLDITDALDLLLEPRRLAATLRK